MYTKTLLHRCQFLRTESKADLCQVWNVAFIDTNALHYATNIIFVSLKTVLAYMPASHAVKFTAAYSKSWSITVTVIGAYSVNSKFA